MNRMRKFMHLSSTERHLLVKAAFLLGGIRLGLWLLPFHRLQALLARVDKGQIELRNPNRPSADRITWAVTVVSRYVPGATCLTQALAGRVLLAQWGYPAHLQIGVVKGPGGNLEAHAWLESQGRTVIGDWGDLARYAPLSASE